jgi:hypothetical protein
MRAFLLSLRFSSPLKISAAPRLICTGLVARLVGELFPAKPRADFAVRRMQAEVRGRERVRAMLRELLFERVGGGGECRRRVGAGEVTRERMRLGAGEWQIVPRREGRRGGDGE